MLIPPGEQSQVCSFLWIYYGYPASCYEGINVEACRNRCGAALARADNVEVDFVAGIPDSGIGHAIGYAAEANLPYRRPFVKYTPTWPRSFMPQEQRVRDLVARMKLIPVEELIEGNRLLFCEDSIVRGTQLNDIIRRLFDRGALEVHMRPACPPLLHSCKFLNFSQSKSELDLAGTQGDRRSRRERRRATRRVRRPGFRTPHGHGESHRRAARAHQPAVPAARRHDRGDWSAAGKTLHLLLER